MEIRQHYHDESINYDPYWIYDVRFLNKLNQYDFNKKSFHDFRTYNYIKLDSNESFKDSFESYEHYVSNLNSIKEGDAIKFTKTCSFPKLFLKDANVGLRRTIKTNLANNIIVDKSDLLNSEERSKLKVYHLFHGPLDASSSDNYSNNYCYVVEENHLEDSGFTTHDVELVFSSKYQGRFISFPSSRKLNAFFEIVNEIKDKLTTTDQLCVYLNSKLPELEYKETLLSLLKSSDLEQNKLGLNMVKMFSLSNCLYDVLEALATSSYRMDPTLYNSVNFKYLLGLCNNISYHYLRNHWNYEYRIEGPIKEAMSLLVNSDIIAEEQKKKCWFKFLSLTGYYYTLEKEQEDFSYDNFDFSNWTEDMLNADIKSIFDKYNMPYVCPEMKDNLL